MLDQQTPAETMNGRDIGPFDSERRLEIAITDQRTPDPLAQFASSGLGEGYGQYALGPHLFFPHPLGKCFLNVMGFARPCPCRHNRKFSHFDHP